MNKRKLHNIFTKTILASSLLYATSSTAAPCDYINLPGLTVVSGNQVCTPGNPSIATPLTILLSNVQFNGTVDITSTVTELAKFGATISGANVTFTKAVNSNDLVEYSATKSLDGFAISNNSNVTFQGGITISNPNAPVTSGLRITDDSKFTISSLSSNNNNRYGLYIEDNVTGTFSGAVNISNINRAYSVVDGVNKGSTYGMQIAISSNPIFQGPVTLTNNKNLATNLGVGISINSNAYPNFNNNVTIIETNPTNDSNTTGIEVINAKANFSSLNTQNHKVHILAKNSTVNFNGAVSISDGGVINLPTFGINANTAANLNFNSTIDITGPLTYGINIEGNNTIANITGAVTINDNYNAISIIDGGKGVFTKQVTIDKKNTNLVNVDGITISSAQGIFDEAVKISNMNRAIDFKQTSSSFKKAITISDSYQGILVGNSSTPSFTGTIDITRNAQHPIIANELDTYGIKIDNNSALSFNDKISITNVHKGIILDNASAVTFNGNISINDQRNFAFSSNGMLVDNGSNATLNKDIVINSVNGIGLGSFNGSNTTVRGTLTANSVNNTAIYVGNGAVITLDKQPTLDNNKIGLHVDGINAKAWINGSLVINNSKNSGIVITNGANQQFHNTITIKGTNLDHAIGIFNSTAIFDNAVNYSGGVGLDVEASTVTFNNTLTGTAGTNEDYYGINADLASKITFNNQVILQNGYEVGLRAINNSDLLFNGGLSISSADTAIYAGSGTKMLFNQQPSLNNNNIALHIDGVGTNLQFNNPNLTITNSKNSGIILTNGANHQFQGNISISGNNLDQAIGIFDSTAIFNNKVNYSGGAGLNAFAGNVTLNNTLTGTGNGSYQYYGVNAESSSKITFNNFVDLSNGYNIGVRAVDNSDILFKNSLNVASSGTGIYIGSGAEIASDQPLTLNNNNIGLHIDGINSQLTGNFTLNILQSKNSGIILSNGANQTFQKNINIPGSNLDHAIGIFDSTAIFNNKVNYSGGAGIHAFSSNVTFNQSIFGQAGANEKYIGIISDSGTNMNLNNLVELHGYQIGIRAVADSNTTFDNSVSISSTQDKAIYIDDTPYIYTGFKTIPPHNSNAVALFRGALTLQDNKYHVYIKNADVTFEDTINFTNSINSGVFTNHNSIQILGADSKVSFVDDIIINNSLSAIILGDGADLSFGNHIAISQDLSGGPNSNINLLPTDGISFTGGATGKFDGNITVRDMTNRAIYIQDSSPIFNEFINLIDNKNGIIIEGASNAIFNNAIISLNIIESGKFNSDNVIKVSGVDATPDFYKTTIQNSLAGIIIEDKANPTFDVISISVDDNTISPTDGIIFTGGATGKFDGTNIYLNNITNRAIYIQDSSPLFNSTISLANNTNGIVIEGSSSPIFTKIDSSYNTIESGKFNSDNIIKISGVDATPIFTDQIYIDDSLSSIIVEDGANPVFNGYIQISQGLVTVLPNPNPITLPSDGISFTAGARGKFDGTIALTRMLNRGLYIQDSSPVFNHIVTSRFHKDGIVIEGASTPIFNDSFIATVGDNAIKITGADATPNFLGEVAIRDHLVGITLENKANPSFNKINITRQDFGPVVNTNPLSIDGIVFTGGATGKFDDIVEIREMTNSALNINASSPVFNHIVNIFDSTTGILMDGASAPIFNQVVNISNTDTTNLKVGIGVNITDSSDPTFANISVTKNNYGIKISDNSHARFITGMVNITNNRGPNLGEPNLDPSEEYVYGIKIINNSSADFNKLGASVVSVSDNYHKNISDVDSNIAYNKVAQGIYIDDNSSANFAGEVRTSMLNIPQQISEGIGVRNNSNVVFDGSVSTSSHNQSIIIDNSSKATFNNTLQMLEERLVVPLSNSSGLTVDNSSELLANNITVDGFWRAGIEIKNGSVAHFKGIVTAKNNVNPLASNQPATSSGSTAIMINNATAIFDQQPVFEGNSNGINITGQNANVTFNTDLLFTDNIAIGITLSDVKAINFKNINYNSNSSLEFATLLDATDSNAIFNGVINCEATGCIKSTNSNLVFNETLNAENLSLPGPNFTNTSAIESKQSTQLIFNKAVNVDNFYSNIKSVGDEYIVFKDTVNIVNNQGYGIGLYQPVLAEFQESVNIASATEVPGYGIIVSGVLTDPLPHKAIFYDDITLTNQATGIFLENSNVEFKKSINITSDTKQYIGTGIQISEYNEVDTNKAIFSGDITIKSQDIGIYQKNNNTIFNGNVTIADSKYGIHAEYTTQANNALPIFNKNVTINNTDTGILVSGGINIFNGPVVINNSAVHGINLVNSGNATQNGKLYFNNIVEINDSAIGINTNNQFGTNHLIFEKGLTINNPNVPASNEVLISNNDYITFNGNSPVNAKIQGGIITFNGVPTISRPISGAQVVDFTVNDPSKRISFNADVGGAEIYTNSVIIGIDNNITFTGNLRTDNTIFDLGSNILTIDGSFTHANNNPIPLMKVPNSVGGITIDLYYDGNDAGHFEFATPFTLIDLSNSSKMTINITEALGIPVLQPGEIRQFDLFVGNGVDNFYLIDQNNITINTNNPLSKWTIDTEEGILYQSLKNNAVDDMFKMVDSDGSTDPLMKSNEFVQELVNIIMDKGPIGGTEALDKIGNPDAVVTSTAPLDNITTGIIDTKLANIVGAGDEESIYGAWFAPLYGIANQKETVNQPGFKASYFGGIIGFDTKIDENLSIGIAGSIANGKLRHTDLNKGDRTNYMSYSGILYLSYDLNERWVLQNTFSYGLSRVRNKEIRISTPTNKIAKAKYDERRMSDTLGLGYKKMLSNDILLIPFFAVDVTRLGSINYTETGADIQNLKFSRESLMEIDGIFGARLSRNFEYEDFVITPAVVANMRYAISQRKITTDVRLASNDEIQLVPKTVSPDRKLYRLGTSVNINNNDMDLLINYEFRKAHKFISHQGSLKVQLSF
ncbi:MAG: autotransporter domain-containing protein [Rickettsiaceae bacterium]|nr:autotransporter domain-containing protein [Rickettsiaceae bacterium]